MEPDQLFSLRNSFWIGSFQDAIHEGAALPIVDDAMRVERDVFVYRSHIAIKNHGIVLDELAADASAAPELQAVRLFAEYCQDQTQGEAICAKLAQLNDAQTETKPLLQVITGTVFTRENNYKDALRYLRATSDLEVCALSVQVYSKMNRPDLAEKTLNKMKQQDEDSTLTELASAWVHIMKGGNGYQEAAYIFKSLMDKFAATSMLLNGLATCNMHMKQYAEAEQLLFKVPNVTQDPAAVVNLITCSEQLRKTDAIPKYLAQLQKIDPQNQWLLERTALMESFDRSAKTFA